LSKKEKAFSLPGISVFAGHMKNAFFHYIAKTNRFARANPLVEFTNFTC